MEPFLGQIELFPYTYAPRNWVFCDGRELPIDRNQALFSLIGTQFGGDGQKTFAVPDLREQAPKNMHYCIAVQGVWPQRD